VFLIQATQNRDTLALQIMLDELIVATKDARDQFAGIEDEPEDELEQKRERFRAKEGWPQKKAVALSQQINSRLPGSRLGQLREHALQQGGIAVNAARLQEMLDFRGQLVDGRIFRGELRQGDTEFERGLKIRRTLSSCVRKREVENGHRPWRLDQCLHFG